MLAARFNRDGHEIIDHHTYAIASDGDMQEGVASEASLAGRPPRPRQADRLLRRQPHPARRPDRARRSARTWASATRPTAGTCRTSARTSTLDALEAATRRRRTVEDRPVARSSCARHIGYGSRTSRTRTKAHGSPLGEDEVRADQGGLRLDPRQALLRARTRRSSTSAQTLRARPRARGGVGRRARGLPRRRTPTLGTQLELIMDGAPARRLGRRLPPASTRHDGAMATRKASSEVIQWAAAKVPHAGRRLGRPRALHAHRRSTDGGDVERGDYAGRNVHYGVREHGMGAIVNGLELHGFRAFGATFLNFSDYMKRRGPAGGADGAAVDLRVHARLDRPRRGRPDAPAGRAARGAARDPEHQRGPPGRRQRDRAGLALRDGAAARRRRRSC